MGMVLPVSQARLLISWRAGREKIWTWHVIVAATDFGGRDRIGRMRAGQASISIDEAVAASVNTFDTLWMEKG